MQENKHQELNKIFEKSINDIEDYYNELFMYKEINYNLWNKIARYCDLDIKLHDYETEGDELDLEINDATIINAVDMASNNEYGKIVGDGNFFKIVNNDGSTENQEFFDEITKIILEHFNNADSKFNETFLQTRKEKNVFGNIGISVFKNDKYNEKNNLFIFKNYNIEEITFDEGENRKVDTVFVDYNETNKTIYENFKPFLNEEFKQRTITSPLEKTAYRLCIMRNPYFKSKQDIGIKNKEFVGIYYFVNNKQIIKTDLYNFKPIIIERAEKLHKEIYGRARGTKIIKIIELLNKISGWEYRLIKRAVLPPLGQYAGTKTNRKPLDLTGEVVNDFEFIKELGGSSPVFQLAPTQAPVDLIRYYKDVLIKQIYTAFNVDSLLDTALTSSQATATEVLARQNIRDILLYGMIKSTCDQSLTPLIGNAINIFVNYILEKVKKEQENLDINNLNIVIGNNINVPAEIIEKILLGKQWYEIQYTYGITRINNNLKIQDILNYVQNIMNLANADQSLLYSIDFYQVLKDFENLYGFGNSYLIEKDKYETIKMQLQQLVLNQQQQTV